MKGPVPMNNMILGKYVQKNQCVKHVAGAYQRGRMPSLNVGFQK
jgi:hypothetical protein